MSSSRPARAEPIARDVRQLPANPSLEYERKEAKALLRQLRTGDSDGVSRVRSAHPAALRERSPAELRLADAQHVIAREYGFASWPKLVAYFAEMERHRNSPRHNSSDGDRNSFDAEARRIVRGHRVVTPFHLLAGIVSQPSEPGVRLLEQLGATVDRIHEYLKQNL